MWSDLQFPADLVTSIEKILNRKLDFLCSVLNKHEETFHLIISHTFVNIDHEFVEMNPSLLTDSYPFIEHVHQHGLPTACRKNNVPNNLYLDAF